jgi:hypothetical protein
MIVYLIHAHPKKSQTSAPQMGRIPSAAARFSPMNAVSEIGVSMNPFGPNLLSSP